MPSDSLVRLLALIDVALVCGLIAVLWKSRELKSYWPIVLVVLSTSLPECLVFVLRWLHSVHRIESPQVGYQIYFWFYWAMYAVGALASILVIYKIFAAAMRPLKGLQDLGRIIFYWVAGISLALAVSGSLTPQAGGSFAVIPVVTQLVRTSSILVASLMLFVAFCIQPLGLSYRSRVFGVSIGLTLVSMMNLIVAARLGRGTVVYGFFSIAQFVLQFAAELIWIYYFSVPEPVRKFILLPTTSPFHKWNAISEQLGHEPGFVAIGGVAPEVFASAEIEIFHRASAKMPHLAVPTAPGPTPADKWLCGTDDR